jgi:BirA family biotin operon repressor/biotin-[acetyl-CoA-carboxylase] ligase
MSSEFSTERLLIDDDVDPLGRQAVLRLLEQGVCGSVDYRRTIPSTNSLALAELQAAQTASVAEPAAIKLFLADDQTAGRGRHGRRWQSSHETLTFSLLASREFMSQRARTVLPLLVAVGIARFIEFDFAPVRVRLKWPNDVFVGGGKVAGILMESSPVRADMIVIGVGINVGQPPILESAAENQLVRGLSQVLGRSMKRYELLSGIVTHLVQEIHLPDDQVAESLTMFRQRCLLTNQPVRFQDGARECQGMCRGISDSGALIVQTDSGTRHLHSGEAHQIRPRLESPYNRESSS